MDFYFENAGINTYLVYRVKESEELDTMSLGMLTNNKINGLASTVFTQMDNDRFIKYNVSAKISVKQFFSGIVNKARLLGVFSGIVNAMSSAEDYMIATENILMDTEYMFSDVSTCETVLICLPIQSKKTQVDLRAFFKTIMFNTQFDQTENCDYVARIINHLNSVPVFSLSDFKNVIDGLASVTAPSQKINRQTEQKQALPKQEPIPPVRTPVQPHRINEVPPVSVKKRAYDSSVSDTPLRAEQNQMPNPMNNTAGVPFNIPGQSPAAQVPKGQVTGNEAVGEKKITMFELLRHYNSENAAAYKAQKAAKKAGASTGAAANEHKSHKEKDSGKNKKNAGSPAFSIPGQTNIPGQQAVRTQPMPEQSPVQPIRVQTSVSSGSAGQVPSEPAFPSMKFEDVYKNEDGHTVDPPVIPRQPMFAQTANFGETTVLGSVDSGQTSVLVAAGAVSRQVSPYLIRKKNNENIAVNKPVFRIGKEKSYVDYFISDNTAISRSHANIISRDGKYFIVDTNSTNHTFIDGQMIPSSTETEITNGTKIRFANEDFEFRIC